MDRWQIAINSFSEKWLTVISFRAIVKVPQQFWLRIWERLRKNYGGSVGTRKTTSLTRTGEKWTLSITGLIPKQVSQSNQTRNYSPSITRQLNLALPSAYRSRYWANIYHKGKSFSFPILPLTSTGANRAFLSNIHFYLRIIE